MEYIEYTSNPDNCSDVIVFIGATAQCDLCDGYGEYETESGPRSCNECMSRLIPFIDEDGNRVTADRGDRIVRTERGLKLIKPEERLYVEPIADEAQTGEVLTVLWESFLSNRIVTSRLALKDLRDGSPIKEMHEQLLRESECAAAVWNDFINSSKETA